MKILVFSDSHGCISYMEQAVIQEAPDLIVHLGDCWHDSEELSQLFPDIPMERVPGNCDFRSHEPLEKTLQYNGCSLFICHGHTLRVKESYQIARYTGMEHGVQLLLFGHTHIPFLDESPELTLLNPGSIGRTRPSYATILIENGSHTCQLHSM